MFGRPKSKKAFLIDTISKNNDGRDNEELIFRCSTQEIKSKLVTILSQYGSVNSGNENDLKVWLDVDIGGYDANEVRSYLEDLSKSWL